MNLIDATDRLAWAARKGIALYLLTRREVGAMYWPDGKTWRKIDANLAGARFDGYTEALSILGYGMTPAAIHLGCMDAVNAANAQLGERPTWRPMHNIAMKVWDDFAVRALVERWKDKG